VYDGEFFIRGMFGLVMEMPDGISYDMMENIAFVFSIQNALATTLNITSDNSNVTDIEYTRRRLANGNGALDLERDMRLLSDAVDLH